MPNNNRRNASPHKSARVAMVLFSASYAHQQGGSMDFWDTLNASERETCRSIVTEIDAAPDEFFAPPLPPAPVSVVVASMREYAANLRARGYCHNATTLERYCEELDVATTGETPND